MTKDEFLSFYNQYAEPLYRFCFFRVRNREDASDLVSETFMRAWRYLQRGENVEHMQAFLYRTARNAVINHAKKKRPLSIDELSDSGFDATAHGIPENDRVDIMRILQMLDQLDELHREVIILRYVNDLEPREIADVLGVSANVVSVRITRAIEMIRKLLTSNTYV